MATNQKSLPDSKRFPFLSFGGYLWPQLPRFGQFRDSGLLLYPAAQLGSGEQDCFYDQLPPAHGCFPWPPLEGPHRLLNQLMVFVITVIGCPCSHSLSPCPKGRNSGASCRPHTCVALLEYD